ncbi:ASC-1 homology (ASCH) domain-containing protein [Gracilibacillus ureilyticus]|uniref:ASC-1 homology (ASCH) domain-containing protein n=1 Tax=Gracilibacillus ureilyticus TaxID=531814 RepID=A0A1H9W4W9_9BACI|nr:ASCH domain-containing protein [Gracilibacillus ureilyticus]SES28513.1 ASC-1 homology (ASCH) domain-containing protein [Gracilibacillus ureilyticus]
MEHNMGLYETPFHSVKSGKKTVEVRLNDEKRRKVNIGDTIKFTKIPGNKETVTVEVTDLRQYSTFREMYENIPASDFDAVGDSVDEMVEQTYQIYTPEKEREWGTLAITVKVC